MCGILGIASKKPVTDQKWLAKGNLSINHRGPDDTGSWWSDDARIGLSHRRLAIIDLSINGHQPMHNHQNDIVIVFNGEIYNYKELRDLLKIKGHAFNTVSDTEVIMHAYKQWGRDCLQHFNGMFTFALYDKKENKLMIARDRAGEKPLYYSCINGSIRFASEMKALMSDPSFPRKLNYTALDCYLLMGFVPGDLCILDHVKKLPPAHYLLFDLENADLKVSRYWELPSYEPTIIDSEKDSDILDELEKLLEDSVRLQLVAADVPVGVLLSGGVDSSLVTAMAVRAAEKVKTFTITFPGHAKHDEAEHARLIANHFKTDHMELQAAEADPSLLEMMAKQFDEPMADSSMIPTFLVSKLIKEHCTVALGGDGGDELFGGYPHYNRLLMMQQKIGMIPHQLRSVAALTIPKFLPTGFKGRNWIQAAGTDFNTEVPLIASFFDKSNRTKLMKGKVQWHACAEKIRTERIPKKGDFLERVTRMDFENYLAEDILVKVDRSSMLNSLELRAPFLDYRIVEFAFKKVPTRLKADPKNRKILLKQLCSRLLPPEFDINRKQGFSIPLSHWLDKGPWGDLFNDVLQSSNSFFDQKMTAKLLTEQKKGHFNSERLYSLVLFELWKKEYKIES